MVAVYNILKHEMVPEHILLSEEEAEKMLKEKGITRDQLPKIKESDPAIEVLKQTPGSEGVGEGSVIKIVRNSPTGGRFEVYRLVTKRLSE